jgi:hypothetical protein
MRNLRMTTRRRFIRFVLFLCTALAFTPSWAFRTRSRKETDKLLVYKLGSIITSISSACVIGRKYLETKPFESNLNRLVELICITDDNYTRLIEADNRATLQLIQNWIRDDFSEGRITTIAGWHLSRTEARIYALTSMLRH